MTYEGLDIRAFRHASPPQAGDAGVAALARVQGGMVSIGQLNSAGLDRNAVLRRVERGVLHRAGRGVYAVGYPRQDDEARAWRAVLMYPGAALSRTSGAWAHGLRRELGRVHLSSPTQRRSSAAAVLHTVTTLDVETRRGLPCTTLARTFLDCAATLPPDQLAAMLRRAEELRSFDLHGVVALLDQRRGSPALRSALRLHRAQLAHTKSELERRFRGLVLQQGLPEPRWNAFVLDFWVDAHWPGRGVVVELDGGTHRTVAAQDSDTRRDALLTAAGYVPLRFTWAQVTEDRAHVLRTLRAVL